MTVKILAMKFINMRVLSGFLLILGIVGFGCSHKKSEVSSAPISGIGGLPHPTGGAVISPNPLPEPGLGEEAGVSEEESLCPGEGSFLVVNPFKSGAERVVGPLQGGGHPVFEGYQGHIGGRIGDFQIYKEGSSTYLIMSYGRTLVKRAYNISSSQAEIDAGRPLAEKELPASPRALLVFSYQNKNWIVAATSMGLHILTTSERENFSPVVDVLFPEPVISLYRDEAKNDLYAATEKNIYRLNWNSIKGGCVEQLVKREVFLDRSIQKIQIAKNKLFIFSEKALPPAEMDLSWVPGAFKTIVQTLAQGMGKVIESVWDPSFKRIDVINLNNGGQTVVPSGGWHVGALDIGRIQLSDFFVYQDKLYLVADHIMSGAENASFQTSLGHLLADRNVCQGADTHCPLGAQLIARIYLSAALDLPVALEQQEVADYFYKQAGLVVFGDLNQLSIPSQAHFIKDDFPMDPMVPPLIQIRNFRKSLWGLKGLVNGRDIYMAGSRTVIRLQPAGNSFNQLLVTRSAPSAAGDLDAWIRSLRQVDKIGYAKAASKEALLTLKGFIVDRSLENLVLSDVNNVREYKGRNLPENVLGRRDNDIFTFGDLSEFGNATTSKWHWDAGSASRLGIPMEGWNYQKDRFSFEPVLGNLVYAHLEGDEGGDPQEAKYRIYISNAERTREAGWFIKKKDEVERPAPGGFGVCKTTTERVLKDIRSFPLPHGAGETLLFLFAEKYTFSPACLLRTTYSSLVAMALNNEIRGDTSFLKVALNRIDTANLDHYQASFVGDARWVQGSRGSLDTDYTYVLARSGDGLYMVNRYLQYQEEDPENPLLTIRKSKLVEKRNMGGLLVSTGAGRDVILAKKNDQHVQFYRYLLNVLYDPAHLDFEGHTQPPLAFDVLHELAYDLPIQPLYGNLLSILTLDNNHMLFDVALLGGGERLEILQANEAEAGRAAPLSRLATHYCESLLGVGFDKLDPKNLALTTANNGLELFHLPSF